MRLNRTSVVVILLAVLLLAAAPAVQAAPQAKPQATSRHLGGDWLSAALTWLSHLFADPTPQAPTSQQKGSSTTTSTSTGGGTSVLGGGGSFAGNCIDPNGCYDGGGG